MRQVTRDLMTNSLSAEFIRHSGGRRLLVSQVPSLPINSVRQEPHPPKFLPTKVDAKFLCHQLRAEVRSMVCFRLRQQLQAILTFRAHSRVGVAASLHDSAKEPHLHGNRHWLLGKEVFTLPRLLSTIQPTFLQSTGTA